MSNTNLHSAKKAKNDEFLTRIEDIESECSHYIEEFKGKYVYCPCDCPDSNFYRYFKAHFYEFGIKRLTATGYYPKGDAKAEEYKNGIRTDFNGYAESLTPWNGDFRAECNKDIRNKADIIITNPPFSVWREFFAWIKEGQE